jgi:hypothetical protein
VGGQSVCRCGQQSAAGPANSGCLKLLRRLAGGCGRVHELYGEQAAVRLEGM